MHTWQVALFMNLSLAGCGWTETRCTRLFNER